MAWAYLHDFGVLKIGMRYKAKLMPDNRELMGTLEEVRLLDGELNKGFLGFDTGRFTVNEYQYIQFQEYEDKWTTYKRALDEYAIKLREEFPKLWDGF
jgi:hypothetical protein